jgi:hypothetical protein
MGASSSKSKESESSTIGIEDLKYFNKHLQPTNFDFDYTEELKTITKLLKQNPNLTDQDAEGRTKTAHIAHLLKPLEMIKPNIKIISDNDPENKLVRHFNQLFYFLHFCYNNKIYCILETNNITIIHNSVKTINDIVKSLSKRKMEGGSNIFTKLKQKYLCKDGVTRVVYKNNKTIKLYVKRKSSDGTFKYMCVV